MPLEHILNSQVYYITFFLLWQVVTLTDFTLHFSLTFTKLLYCKFIPLLNNFTMQEKCY